MTGERAESIEVRFVANDMELSVRMCVGNSDTVDSARFCRVWIEVVALVVRLREGLVSLAGVALLEAFVIVSRCFFDPPKGVVTLPSTPVTPPNKALPPPATSLGALVSTSIMPLPIVSNVWPAQPMPGKPPPGVLPEPTSFSRKRFMPSFEFSP
jgi:hypothetical protein